MTTYATYAEFTQVYSLRGVSQAEVESAHLPRAAAELNTRLGAYFTVPFSGNETAKWLNIDLAAAVILRRNLKQDENLKLEERIDKIITDIVSGNAPMILNDGTALFASAGGNQGFWSNTQEYKSVFDLRDPERQRVSLDLLDQLSDEDN